MVPQEALQGALHHLQALQVVCPQCGSRNPKLRFADTRCSMMCAGRALFTLHAHTRASD